MCSTPKICVIGDVHRDFGGLNKWLNCRRPDIVLQCGDFGYWPREPLAEIYGRNNPRYPKKRPRPKVPVGTQIYWCDGNHEDFEELQRRTTDELWPRTRYMPRGSVLTLPDGRHVMFFGGAQSIDRASRRLGIDWFPEERISDADIRNLEYDGSVDIMVTHTCPREFELGIGLKEDGYYRDCSRDALSYLLDRYRPPLWYFGHWHYYITGYDRGCRWTALDYLGHGHWWEELRQQ